ncbi:MAG: hypothetical protein ACRBK7_32440 [Acidimicrobiales bacterium]
MGIKTKSLTALSVTVFLAAAGCTSTSTETAEGVTTAVETTDGQALANSDSADAAVADGTAGLDLDDIVRRLGDGYSRVDGDWPGFAPNEHPAVLALKTSSGELAGALAINFPNPDALGDAEPLNTDGTPLKSVHHITNPTEADKLAELAGFDFHIMIGGVDAFAMEAGGGDDFFLPTTNDYVGTFLHELFHRWQDQAFEGDIGAQDVEGYAYTPENLELAALEERALIEAAQAQTDEARTEAAKHFAGIRLARMAADDRVADLDNSQERYEGSARYLEHRIAGTDDDFSQYNENDYSIELAADPSDTGGVKDHYGFGRFYATGASILGLLDALGAEDVDEKVEGGLSPAEVLIEFLDVSASDAADLVDEARTNYDPLDELPSKAAESAAAAKDEPPVFSDDDFPSAEDDGGDEGDNKRVADVVADATVLAAGADGTL